MIPFDKQRVAASFTDAAAGYDAVADVQRVVGQWLLQSIQHQQDVNNVLDVGCGSGTMTMQLAARLPLAEIDAIDISLGMLEVAVETHDNPRVSFYEGDAEAIPFEEKSFDLVYSNFMLQWCPDPVRALTEMRRVLRRGGQLVLSLPGTGTLNELASAWRSVDDCPHVHPFSSEDDFADAVAAAGFAHADILQRRLRVHVPDAMALMRALKALGAHNLHPSRPPHLTGKSALQKVVAHYEARREPAGLPVTWNVLMLAARR
jgi:malonyl-CoA O-methyltransferase